MIQIDMDMPKRCSECPLLLNIRTEDGRWFYVCNNERKMWILFEHEGTEESVDKLVKIPKPLWCSLKEAEPKHGEWILDSDPGEPWRYRCSECGEKTTDTCEGEPMANYCPNCGAKMEEEDG